MSLYKLFTIFFTKFFYYLITLVLHGSKVKVFELYFNQIIGFVAYYTNNFDNMILI